MHYDTIDRNSDTFVIAGIGLKKSLGVLETPVVGKGGREDAE
jgi:hypothetical protein